MIRVCAMLNGILTESAVGDAELTILEILAQWQRRPGVHVEIVTTSEGYAALAPAYPRLAFRAPHRTAADLAGRFGDLARLRQALRVLPMDLRHYDIAICSSLEACDVLPALWLKLKRHARRTAVHVSRRPERRLTQAAESFLDCFWVDNDELAEALADLEVPRRKIEYAHLDYRPIPPEAVTGAPERFEAIAVGLRSIENDTHVLYEAWRRVRRRFPGAHLVVVGQDEPGFDSRAQLAHAELESAVTIIPSATPGQIAGLLRRARLLAQPNRTIADGRTITEALACRVPCVTFDLPAFRYAFPWGRAIAAPPTPEALADRILDVLEDEQLVHRLVEDIEAHFWPRRWEEIADLLWSHAFRN